MARKTSQQHRKAPIERHGADRGDDSPIALDIGPDHRLYYRPDFPDLVAQSRAVWERCRSTYLAEYADRPELPRPFGYLAFDRLPEETRPGPVRDALVAEGRLTAAEVSMMGSYHLQSAYAAIRATGATLAEWIAAPDLAARTIALCGWDPFDEETLVDLRSTDEERMARRYQATADEHGEPVTVTGHGITTTYRPRLDPATGTYIAAGEVPPAR